VGLSEEVRQIIDPICHANPQEDRTANPVRRYDDDRTSLLVLIGSWMPSNRRGIGLRTGQYMGVYLVGCLELSDDAHHATRLVAYSSQTHSP
jgi:hypothetical protein